MDSMDPLDFTEEEIREQLVLLGYTNIPKHKLHQFKQDLDELIRRGEWRSLVPSPEVTSQPSPPAYTKEKVSSNEASVLHAAIYGNRQAHNTQVVLTCPNLDERALQRPRDSYAQHSVAPKLQLAGEAPCRLQVEPDPNLVLNSTLSDSHTSSLDSQERRFIKRKVMRNLKGQRHVCDESFYSEDSDAASCLEERLDKLRVSPLAQAYVEAEHEEGTDRSSDSDAGSTSAFESYAGGLTRTRSDGDLRPKPKSFIRPTVSQQTIKKSDPVARYFQYKQIWDMFRCPGEVDRRALRWEIKERLAYQPPPLRPRRVYVPNTYVVPTEKKRSALRWEVRTELANGLQPHKASCRF
ncbi:unnamed protein product [Ophioblennius macclurei]